MRYQSGNGTFWCMLQNTCNKDVKLTNWANLLGIALGDVPALLHPLGMPVHWRYSPESPHLEIQTSSFRDHQWAHASIPDKKCESCVTVVPDWFLSAPSSQLNSLASSLLRDNLLCSTYWCLGEKFLFIVMVSNRRRIVMQSHTH